MRSPESGPRAAWQRAVHRLSAPWRLFQSRTSFQLIASYVAVVLLVILLFQVTVMISLLWQPETALLGSDDGVVDPYLGERAGAYIQWLDPDEIADIMDDDLPSPARIADLSARLDLIATGEVPGFSGLTPISRADDTTLAVISDPSGRVVAASSNSLSPRQTLDDLPNENLIRTATRNRLLAGARDEEWNALYSLDVAGGHTAVAHPIITDDGRWVGTLTMQGGALSSGSRGTRVDFLRNISLTFLQSLWIFAVPAVIVAVPFGIWRTRAITKRLQRLAGAAEAMANGNLRTRVRIMRRDEIGRLAESFNAMAEHIDTYDQSRRAFISNITHELRTPVSIIMGTAERMQHHPEGQQPVMADALQIIQHEGDMLVRLTDDLFTIARLEEHNLRLVRKPNSVYDVTQDVLSGVSQLAWSERKISVENLVSPELPAVFADAQRLRQIISNLVYNALRHTPEGGLVVVQAAKADGGMVEISISDTGMGMDEETASNVFTRYYQSERSRRHGEGSGLGLSVVQQLVYAHGGEVEVESIPNQGTTFRFTIPIAS